MKKKIFIMMLVFTSIAVRVSAQIKLYYPSNNVCIGSTTVTPISPLDAYGNLSVGTATSATSIGKVQITTGGASPINNRLTFGTDNSGWKFAISKSYYYRGSNYVADLMTIQDNGNVGIGTTSPSYSLDVSGNIRASAAGIFYNSYVIGNTQSFGFYWANSNLGYFSFPTSYVATIMNANVGIGTTSPGTFALNVNGTTACNGNAWTSDQQFKTNADSMRNALTTIRQLKPKSYYFDTTNVYGFKFQSQKQYGFIAQDVEKILPNLVTTSTKPAEVDSSGHIVHPSITYKSLNYIAFISILTKGIQELSKTNDSLARHSKTTDSLLTVLQKQFTSTTASLLQQITNCCSKGINQKTTGLSGNEAVNSNAETTLQIDLANNNQIILYQNEPNPFGSSTIIRYFVPENINETVYVVFYDTYGKEVNKLEVKEKGFGKIEANTENLASGIYSYSLIVNNKTIDTKKMMRSK